MNKMLKKAFGNVAVVRPSNGPNLTTMLNEALALHQQGRYGEAATAYGEILEIDPEHFDALHLLGVAAMQTGNPSGALTMMDKALIVNPNSADALSNRSSALMGLGRAEEALASCDKAVLLEPKHADAEFNAGNALVKLGKRTEAIRRYRKALAVRPDFVACLTNLGGELIDEGMANEAKSTLEKALAINPSHAKAWLNLGALLQEQGDKSAAHDAYQNALAAQPEYPKARVNLSNMAFESGYWTEATIQGQTALDQDPHLPEAHNAVGNCHRAIGQPEEANAEYRQAVELDPGAYGFHSNLLLCQLCDPTLNPESILDEALRYGARHAGWAPTTPRPNRPLKRIGFVSPDLRSHPVGYFLESLLANLEGFEVFLYANQFAHDKQSAKLASLAQAWRPTRRLSTDAMVELIQKDEIDVLIDLAGHTADGRLDVFARRAAPVQVAWLGYSSTTGLSQFDALIGDSTVTPRKHEEHYSEPVCRLPHCFTAAYDLTELPEISPLPASIHGFVTFGSFNATSKTHEGVIELWSEVLKAQPDSKFLFKNIFLDDASVRAHYLGLFEQYGIGAERIELVGQTSKEDHYAAFSKVDIALDTYPYSGATTSVDNLAMGVPVVTILGEHYVGRMSASFLTTVGLGDLVVSSREDYVAKALELAGDLDGLAALRKDLRRRVVDSPLGDAKAFGHDFTNVLTQLWEQAEARAA